MAEYIDKEEILKFPIRTHHYDRERGNAHYIYGIESVMEHIEEIPSADVTPVRHGHWIPQYVSSRGLSDIFECSVCNGHTFTPRKYTNCSDKYCRHCGAKMDKE